MEKNDNRKYNVIGYFLNITGNIVPFIGVLAGVMIMSKRVPGAIEQELINSLGFKVIIGSVVLSVLLKIPGVIILLLSDIEFNTRK